jgi:hypothetical protein
MSSIALIITATLALSTPPSTTARHAQSPMAKALQGEYIIAQQYGDKNPEGSDPHGGDPHDENHDGDLPANKADNDRQATTDVYGGAAGQNTQAPVHGP